MSGQDSKNFWLFLELLAKRRTLIISIVILATLASVVAALVLPVWFRASALLLPPKNISLPLAELSELSEAVSVTSGLNLPIMATASDIYVRILKSRTITSKIMDQFDLKKRYKCEKFEETYLALMKHSDFRVTEEGLLSVAVEDRDPKVAADITNAFVDELDKFNQSIVTERLKQTKDFIIDRLIQVNKDLEKARGDLEDFQMTYKTVDFDEQTRLAIDQAASLKVELAQIEINLKMSEITLGKNNAELIDLQRKKSVVLNQLQQLENQNQDSSFFSLPVAMIPSLKGRYEVLYSRVRVSEALYHMLLEQREKAKIQEYEKMPTISILDKAQPPQIKSRPQRSFIVLGTFGISLIFALFLAALLEYFYRLKHSNPEDYNRAMYFIHAFFGWLPGVKNKN